MTTLEEIEEHKKQIILDSEVYKKFADYKINDVITDKNDSYYVINKEEIHSVILKKPIDFMVYRFYKTYIHMCRNLVTPLNLMTLQNYYTYSEYIQLIPHIYEPINREIFEFSNKLFIKLVFQEYKGNVESFYIIEIKTSNDKHHEYLLSKTLDFKNDDLFLLGVQQLFETTGGYIEIEDIKLDIIQTLKTIKLLNY